MIHIVCKILNMPVDRVLILQLEFVKRNLLAHYASVADDMAKQKESAERSRSKKH